MKVSMQYRAATFMNMFVSSFAIVASIFSFYFDIFQLLTQWRVTLEDVLITYSIATMVFAISEFFV